MIDDDHLYCSHIQLAIIIVLVIKQTLNGRLQQKNYERYDYVNKLIKY